MTPYKQTLFVVWINQLLFFLSVILIWELWMIPVSIISLWCFGFFSESSIHRYYTHKSYKTSLVKEKILRLFALLSGQGAVISWVTVHRTHHAFEDTPKDPHSPLHHSKFKILLGLFPQNYEKTLVIDLMRSKGWNYFVFENKYYWLIWTSIWIASYFLNFYLFYFIVSGSALWYLATSAINILNHNLSVGNKQYSESVATNSKIMNWLTCIGYHNNHHKFPSSYTYSTGKEIDVYGVLIKHLLMD